MDAADLIQSLQSAKEGSRFLDAQIAKALGWTLHVVPDARKPKGKRYIWSSGTTEEPVIVPPFTTDLDAAVELVEKLADDKVYALTVGPDGSTAQAGMNAKTAVASTPALALCIAAVQHL